MATKSDSSRGTLLGHVANSGLTATQQSKLSNRDLARRVYGNTLGLSASVLATKSINDLRVLSSQRAKDDD